MRFHVFESLHAIPFGSGRMTSLDAVEDFCKRPEEKLAAPENENGADGTGHAGAQDVREFGVGKYPRGSLLENVLAGQ
jgi:hypothetical protein